MRTYEETCEHESKLSEKIIRVLFGEANQRFHVLRRSKGEL